MTGATTTALVAAACAACAIALVASPGSAVAGTKTSKVTIETDPPGAKVYFGLKEDGEVCTTPCTIEAPVGEIAILIEAENRRSIFENVTIPRRTARPFKLSYKLEPAIGALIVDGGAGATIKIDDEARGVAPGRVDGVPAGAHHVVLEHDGAVVYDEFVEIEAGRDATVTAIAAPPTPRASARPAVATVATPAPRTRATPAVSVTGAVDVGFRQFTYQNNLNRAAQRDDHEAGQVMLGPIIEVWPTTLLNLGVLPGLALYGRLEFGVNPQAVQIENGSTATRTSLSTAWQSLEISVHQRWTIANAGTIEVGAGYLQDRYQFTGNPDEVAIVPDASYDAIRIGGRASLLLGPVEPYIITENRVVLSGGAMDQRYKLGTSVNGVHGAVGAAVHLGPLEVRVEGGLTLYSWSFKFDASDVAQADGGRDFIQNVTFAIGYVY